MRVRQLTLKFEHTKIPFSLSNFLSGKMQLAVELGTTYSRRYGEQSSSSQRRKSHHLKNGNNF